jgi:hypothetical protein
MSSSVWIRIVQGLARIVAIVLIAIAWQGSLWAQVAACQKQCTSLSPEAPCTAVHGDPNKYSSCVAKCQKECTDCVPDPVRSQPPLALRLYAGNCPSGEALDNISGVLITKLAKLGLQHPDIRPTCLDLKAGGDDTISILIWSTPPRDACDDQTRSAAIPPSDIVGSLFGLYITKELIAELAQAGFDNNSTLQVVPGYPSIHLTHLSVGFLDPNSVSLIKFWCKASFCATLNPLHDIQTYINGHDDRTTPSADFTTTITDQLTPRSHGLNECTPVTDPNCGCLSASHTDVSDIDELIIAVPGIIAGAASLALPIPQVVNLFTNDLDAAFHQPGGGSQGGVGCTLYQSLPDEIALPQTGGIIPPKPSVAARTRTGADVVTVRPQRNKLVINYRLPQVGAQAVTFLGTTMLKPRTPAVSIVGPSSVSIGRHGSITSPEYAVLPVPLQAQDFFGARTYAWSGNPQGADIIAPAKQKTEISFNNPNMKPGTSVTQTITVRVTDAEGSSATASLNVRVSKLTTDSPPPKPNPPPRCKVNPRLPECQTKPL